MPYNPVSGLIVENLAVKNNNKTNSSTVCGLQV